MNSLKKQLRDLNINTDIIYDISFLLKNLNEYEIKRGTSSQCILDILLTINSTDHILTNVLQLYGNVELNSSIKTIEDIIIKDTPCILLLTTFSLHLNKTITTLYLLE